MLQNAYKVATVFVVVWWVPLHTSWPRSLRKGLQFFFLCVVASSFLHSTCRAATTPNLDVKGRGACQSHLTQDNEARHVHACWVGRVFPGRSNTITMLRIRYTLSRNTLSLLFLICVGSQFEKLFHMAASHAFVLNPQCSALSPSQNTKEPLGFACCGNNFPSILHSCALELTRKILPLLLAYCPTGVFSSVNH